MKLLKKQQWQVINPPLFREAPRPANKLCWATHARRAMLQSEPGGEAAVRTRRAVLQSEPGGEAAKNVTPALASGSSGVFLLFREHLGAAAATSAMIGVHASQEMPHGFCVRHVSLCGGDRLHLWPRPSRHTLNPSAQSAPCRHAARRTRTALALVSASAAAAASASDECASVAACSASSSSSRAASSSVHARSNTFVAISSLFRSPMGTAAGRSACSVRRPQSDVDTHMHWKRLQSRTSGGEEGCWNDMCIAVQRGPFDVRGDGRTPG